MKEVFIMEQQEVERLLKESKGEAKIISFYIDKGGTGKSTHSFNFASYCAEVLKKRVLVIDGDRSKSMSTTFGIDGELTITDIFKTGEFSIYHTTHQNIDFICGGSDFTDEGTDIKNAATKYLEFYSWIDENESYLNDTYEFIVIDTHNDTSQVTLNLLTACHLIVNVAAPEGDSFKALGELPLLIEKELKPKTKLLRSKESVFDAEIAILPNKIAFFGNNIQKETKEFLSDISEFDNVLRLIPQQPLIDKTRLYNKSIFKIYESLSTDEKKKKRDSIEHIKSVYADIVALANQKVIESM